MDKETDNRCEEIRDAYKGVLTKLSDPSVNADFFLQPLGVLKNTTVGVNIDENISGAAEIRYDSEGNQLIIRFKSDEALDAALWELQQGDTVTTTRAMAKVLVDACVHANEVRAWVLGLGVLPVSDIVIPANIGGASPGEKIQFREVSNPPRERIKFTKVSNPPRERIKFTKVSPPSVEPEPPDGSSEEPPKGPLES